LHFIIEIQEQREGSDRDTAPDSWLRKHVVDRFETAELETSSYNSFARLRMRRRRMVKDRVVDILEKIKTDISTYFFLVSRIRQ
jgi:hypothetical protein